MARFKSKQMPTIHFVKEGEAKGILENRNILCRIKAQTNTTVEVIHLLVGFRKVQVPRFLNPPTIQKDMPLEIQY